MFPGWPPRYGGSAVPPAPAAPPPGANYQSLRDQHLAQLEQLQRMHQRQLESVLPAGAPAPPPRQFFTPPRGPAAYPYPPPPYGHTVPPPDYQLSPAPPPPPDAEQPPPPPAPEQPPPPPPLPSAEGAPPEEKSGSLEEQQQYYYKQHMLSLQKLKNRLTEASAPASDTPQSVAHTSAGHAAPPPSQELPPVDNALPPAQDATPGMNVTEDPEQAERLKTLQEAAAHWQQHEQHRLGFQYQGIIQKHNALQQLLQRYQQLLVEPPHLTAMSVDVQLQHYEMQQKQLSPLLQEWESQFKKWQELLQTYPHKDQLQDHHVQWSSWQAHMKALKSQIKDKVSSLKSLKQQYGGNHYIAVVPQYPSYSPVMPAAVPPVVLPAVPTVVPPGLNLPPPFSAPGPPMYSTAPPPPLPTAPATAYPETAPPLPPTSAPPLPPVASAPPLPPPGNTTSVEAVQPPLPPDNTGSTEAAAPPPPEKTHATTLPSSGAGASAPAHSSGDPDTSGDKAVSSGYSYQAQQALKNVRAAPYTPLAKNVPSFFSDKPPPDLSTAGPSSSQSMEKHPDPKEVDSKPLLFSSGQLNRTEKETTPPVPMMNLSSNLAGPRFSGPGRGFQSSGFHAPRGGQFGGPRGSFGFRGPRPLLQGSGLGPLPPNDPFQGQNQQFTKEQLAEPAVDSGDGDKSLPRFEPGVHMQPPLKQTWERGEENRDVGKWDKVQGEQPVKKWDQPHNVPAKRWDQPEAPMHPPWDRSVVPPERSWDKAGRDKWDAKGNQFTGRSEGTSQENVDLMETPKGGSDSQPDRQGFGRSEAPPRDMRDKHENSPFDRPDNQRDQGVNKWGDPPDKWGAPDPQQNRSGPNRGPQDRWSMADNTSDRYGDAGGPGPDRGPQDRWSMADNTSDRYGDAGGPGPDRGPQDRWRMAEKTPDSYGGPGPDRGPQDRWRMAEKTPDSYGGPGPNRGPQDRWHMAENTPDRYGDAGGPGPDRGPQDRWRMAEDTPDRYGDAGGPGPDRGPQDRWRMAEDAPDRYGDAGGPGPDRGPQDRWRMAEDAPDRYGDAGGPGPDRGPQDRWHMAENTPDRYGDVGGPGPDRVRNWEGPPQNRFNVHDVPFHGPNRFRFGAPEMHPRGRARFPGGPPPRFVGPEGFNRDRFDNPEGLARERFGGLEGGHQNRFSGPENHPRDHYKGPNFPPPGNHFGGPTVPPERFRGSEFPPNLDQPEFDRAPHDNWGFSEEHDRFDNANKSQDSWVGNRAPLNKSTDRPEWHPESRMAEGRPPVPLDTPVNQDELHGEERWKRPTAHDGIGGEQRGKFGFPPEDQKSHHHLPHEKETAPPDVKAKTDEQTAPKTLSGTFQSRFPMGNQKVTSAELGKTEEVRENIDKTSSDRLLNKASISTVQGPPQQVRPTSPKGKKPAETTDSTLPKTEASGIPKTNSVKSDEKDLPGPDKKVDTRAEVTAPVSNSAKSSGLQESSAISSVKVPAASDSMIPTQDSTKPDVPKGPLTDTTAQTPIPTKPDGIQASSDSKTGPQAPSTAKKDLSTTVSSQSSAPPSPAIRPPAPHILAPFMFGTPQASVRPGAPQAAGPVRPGAPQAAGPVRPGAPQAAGPVRPGAPQAAGPVRPGAPQAAGPVRPGAPQAAGPVRPGAPQAAGPVRPGAPQAAGPVRPGAPQAAGPVRPGAPQAAGPVRPGAPQAAGPFRPGAPQAVRPGAPQAVRPGGPQAVRPGGPQAVRPGGPQAVRPGGPQAVRPGGPQAVRPGGPQAVRPGGPRGPPPIRPGVPRASLLVRPGAPQLPTTGRPGAPWAAPHIRQGIPQASPTMGPEQIIIDRPGRPKTPRLPHPPISDEYSVDAPTDEDDGYEQSIIPDSRAQPFFKGSGLGKSMNEPQIQLDHDPMMEREPLPRMSGPEGPHGHMRPNFPDQDMDNVESHPHHETSRPGHFRDYEIPNEPDYYPDDFPGPRRGNFDPRFHHPSRGRSRGFICERLPPRPGGRDVTEVPGDRGFEPRDPFLEARLPFREGPDDLPPFDREAFHGERRFFERERFLDPLLDDCRRDLPIEGPRGEVWERDRYWRDREPEFPRDPYFREERLPLPIPPLPRDLDIRADPWLRERNLDREGFFDRAERRYLFDADVGRDFPRIPEDLDIPLRERDWPPPRRPLSPHRPFSPVQSRPSLPPLPPLDDFLDERWRLDRDLADRDLRERAELRVREYPDVPLWREDRNRDEFLEKPNLGPRDDPWYPSERALEGEINRLQAQTSVASELLGLSGQSSDSEPAAQGMLALSQRQHEIILKAAQELKMLREQKETLDNLKSFFSDSKSSDPLKPGTDPGALQVPSDSLAKGEGHSKLPPSARDHWDEDSFCGLWDDERKAAQAANLSIGHKLSGIQQTVDYAHGRDITLGKVEQTPYGERVMLLPEPSLERGMSSFPKDYLIDCVDRDFRDREPYFERQSSKHLDRRGYERERDRDRSEAHRERGDHDRERFDRDRHSREERSSASYRDKESSSRRSGSDKPSYERKPERSSYDPPPPAFGATRRTYAEERPAIPPPAPAPPPEKKPETKNVDDLLKKPGRENRPDRIVVIMRGLPGSGKTHVAKLIRDKEVECGGSAPRVLSLDDYFMTEVEKVQKDPESGKKVMRKVMEYEYEPEMEDTYRSGMLKTFKKTLDDGFFPFIILDSIHDRVRHFEQFWSAAKTKGFEVYLAEIAADVQTCAKRNMHARKLKEINKMSDNWEPAPRHMIRLDIRSLLQDAAIDEVEMEDSEPNVEPEQGVKKEAEEEESERGYLPKSKWEMDTSEAKLDKLDGLKTRKRDWESMTGCMEDYLQLPDDYDSRESAPGKKRVRWADLEEKKDADRKRAIGFIVGQTDWEKITDKSGHLAERALNRTKYI